MTGECMWESEFDISAIKTGEMYVISCPTEELERELAHALDGLGLHYPNGEHLSNSCYWHDYGEDFCYFIYEDSMVRRGMKPSNPEHPGIKSTFYGVNTPDFEVASDAELRDFLGIGGG